VKERDEAAVAPPSLAGTGAVMLDAGGRRGWGPTRCGGGSGSGGGGERGATGEERLREEGMGLGLGLDAAYIPREHDENHWIDDRWLQIVGLFGPTWASLFIVFLFLFSFLLHHCELTLKNNYVICTNIFFIYSSMDTSFHLGVSRFFEWIFYFLSFK
jgi:hypothetical protein